MFIDYNISFFPLMRIVLYHVCIVVLTRGFHITHVLVLFVLWHYGYWNHPRHHWPYYQQYRLHILFPITIQNNYFYYYYLPTYKQCFFLGALPPKSILDKQTNIRGPFLDTFIVLYLLIWLNSLWILATFFTTSKHLVALYTKHTQ